MIKRLQDFARKDDAVIEVFSEILLTGIIVIAIAAAAAFVLSSLDEPDNVRVDIDHWVDNKTDTLYFRHIGGETVDVEDLELVVYANGSYETLTSEQIRANYDSDEWALGDIIEINTSSQFDITNETISSKLVHTASSLVIYDAYGSIGDNSGAGGNGGNGGDDGGNDGGNDGGGDPLPDGAVAYDDANGNGQYDDGEATYDESNLNNFKNTSVDLVIQSNEDSINTNGHWKIDANSITLNSNISSNKITLTADNDIDISGQSIISDNNKITIKAGGGLIATDSYINGQTIKLDSSEDMNLNNSNLTVFGNNKDPEAHLGDEATLYVDGLTVESETNKLHYTPNVTEVPESGNVEYDSKLK